MRLIEADTLAEEVENFFMAITGNPKPATVVRECKRSFTKMIEEQPTIRILKELDAEPGRKIDWEREAKKQCAVAGELRILLAERLEEIRCRKTSIRSLVHNIKDTMDEVVLEWKLTQLEEQEAWLESILNGKGDVR